MSKTKRVDTTIGVDLPTAKIIRTLAAEQDRTVASMVRLMVKEWIKDKPLAESCQLTLTWYFDPGHAWLQVPRETLREFGLKASDFSEFSYADWHHLYLEEDCDAGKFLRAVGDKAEIEFKKYECNSQFTVRELLQNINDGSGITVWSEDAVAAQKAKNSTGTL